MTWLTDTRREVSPKTTGRRITSLRAFAQWSGLGPILEDYSVPTPAKHIPIPLPEGMPGVFKMLDACEYPELHTVVALCGMAGLRISEALTLPPASVDFRNGLIRVRGKGDKTRDVPLGGKLADHIMRPVINRFAFSTVVTMDDRLARRSITRLGRRAGIARPVSSHMLRSTFATHLLNTGTNIRVVQEILGHSSVSTTEGYTGITVAQMKDAVSDL